MLPIDLIKIFDENELEVSQFGAPADSSLTDAPCSGLLSHPSLSLRECADTAALLRVGN